MADPSIKKKTSVLEQIEASADYYGPEVYSQLTFYSNFSKSQDLLSQDFIPVAQTKPNPKLFVVGLIPPPANISGRLLDRSGSIASVVGAPEDVDVGKPKTTGVSGSTGGSPTDPAFWDAYVDMCKRLKVDPYNLAAVINSESGFKSGNTNFAAGKDKPPVAKGLNQIIHATGLGIGMTEAEWQAYDGLSAEEQLYWVEKSFKASNVGGKSAGDIYAGNFGSYHNPDGSMYASKEAQAAYIAAHPGAKFKDGDYQDIAIKQNKGLADKTAAMGGPSGTILPKALASFVENPDGTLKLPPGFRAQIDAALARKPGAPGAPPPKPGTASSSGGDGSTGKWVGEGSANASKSKEEDSKTADNGLKDKQAELGKKFYAAQRAEILATAAALQVMRDTPPLRLLVNPTSFKVSSEKIISDGNWTRNGPIIEHWGDGQDTLEGSGKLAGFFAIDANSPKEDAEGEGPGLTRVARNFSASYHNLLSLWLLYRNNASILTEGLDGTAWARLSMLGSIYIYYDNTLYLGSFGSFNLTENDTAPYSLEYTFQFTVRATFLLDRPDEYDYGAKKFFQGIPANPVSAAAAEAALLKTIEEAEAKGGGPVVPEPELLNPEAGGPEILNPEEGVEILNPEDVIPVKKPA